MTRQQKKIGQAVVLLTGFILIGFGYQFSFIDGVSEPAEPTAEVLSYSEVTYQLAWEKDVMFAGEINDLGYKIWLDEGYLVNATIELVPCLVDVQRSIAPWGPPIAYAGHGAGEADDSRFIFGYIETLTELTMIEMDGIAVSDEIYCQAHYLLSPMSVEMRGAEFDMTGRTIWLRGQYQPPGSDQQIPFTLETDLAWGGMVDLETGTGTIAPLQTGFHPATVTVERNLSGLFNGVDFEEMSEIEQNMALLRTIVGSVRVIVTTESE